MTDALTRRPEFRRVLVASLVGHLALLGMLLVAPGPRVKLPAGVLSVDLVGSIGRPAPRPAPKAAPEPAPKPAPAPPPPVPKKVVLPKDPVAPASKPVEKPVVEKPASEPPAMERPEPVEYADVLDALRAEAGEEAPAPASAPATPAALPGSGGQTVVAPEVATWIRRVRVHVRQAWVLPPGFRTQPLSAEVAIEIALDGSVVGQPDVARSSGNPWYDEGVVRAILKASPLPPPPEAGEWSIAFRPEHSY